MLSARTITQDNIFIWSYGALKIENTCSRFTHRVLFTVHKM